MPKRSRYDVEDLHPVRTMPPYEPCWCRSGKKWKFCHKIREAMRPLAFAELTANMQVEAKRGYCSHPDAPRGCSNKLIRSHTVQRSGGLSAIAEDGHVLSPKEGVKFMAQNDGLMVPTKVGINNASTFMGFCGLHDGSMFRPAEHGAVSLNSEVAFLLSFRSVAYEGYNKIISKRWSEINREADAGLPFERQAMFQQMQHWHRVGTEVAIEDFNIWKEAYDEAFKKNDYSRFWYHAVAFEGVLPIAASGGLMPEFDFTGKRVQALGELGKTLDHVTVNLTVLEGRTVAVLGWLGEPDDAAQQFVRSFAEVPDNDVANALLRLCFEHIENLYLTPSWWNALPGEWQTALVHKMKNGLPHGERVPAGLLPDGRDYFPNLKVVERISALPAPA
ncbi:hypothetical protein ACFOMD_12655 [Sphingoaurantiacus capsulatus]|uniref:Zinc chelation protein SecC n=1 Tax=Sphingoaurantiacus capsulatus TaxID=1771310 RepID=A0ABV7XFG0_9SPHN